MSPGPSRAVHPNRVSKNAGRPTSPAFLCHDTGMTMYAIDLVLSLEVTKQQKAYVKSIFASYGFRDTGSGLLLGAMGVGPVAAVLAIQASKTVLFEQAVDSVRLLRITDNDDLAIALNPSTLEYQHG